jgi:hypothetical protein
MKRNGENLAERQTNTKQNNKKRTWQSVYPIKLSVAKKDWVI